MFVGGFFRALGRRCHDDRALRHYPVTIARPRRSPEVVAAEVLDELVAYTPATSQAVSLNVSARAIWELCDGSRTLDDICGELSDAAGLPADALRADVEGAVTQLRSLGLLTLDPD